MTRKEKSASRTPHEAPDPVKGREEDSRRFSESVIGADLEERLRFEALISELSARFVSPLAEELDQEIEGALGRIMEHFGGDRGGLLRVSPSGSSVHLGHAFFSPGIERVSSEVDLVPLFPWAHGKLVVEGVPVSVSRLADLPPEAEEDKKSWTELGVKSGLLIPLRTNGRVGHIIVVETTQRERTWPDHVLPRLRLLGEIFVRALGHRESDRALRESRETLDLAADAADAGFWGFDVRTGLFWANRKARGLFHFPADQPITMQRFLDTVHPEDRDRILGVIRRGVETREDLSTEYRIVPPDGSIRWILSRGRPHLGTDGRLERFGGISIDITERRRAEEEAAKNAREFRAIFELSAIGMAQVDPATDRFLRVNQKFCQITGYTEEELRGLTFRDITHPDDPPNDPVAYAKVLAGEAKDWSIEKRYLRKDGTTRWVMVRGTVIPDEAGRPYRSLAAIADITDRKRADQEILNNQHLINAIFSSLYGHVAVLDRSGTIIAVNEAWTRFASENGGDLGRGGVGANYLEVCRQAAEQGSTGAAEALADIEAVLAGTAHERTLEYRCPLPDGEDWYNMVAHPLRRPEGGAIVTHVNVTARRRAELEVLELRQELSHVTRVSMMGELTASLAHELSQPLTAIQSNAQAAQQMLARGDGGSSELAEILADIVADDRRASETIRRLRSLLRKGTLEVQPLNLNELIREVAGLVKTDSVLRDAALSLELAPDLPLVLGDRVQLQQVLLNLVINALDAVKDAPVRRVKVETGTDGPGPIRVSVEDSGTGIPEGELERIFEHFYTTKAEGMGMGLVISRSIAAAHGGRLWAENAPDAGARFVLALPSSEGDS